MFSKEEVCGSILIYVKHTRPFMSAKQPFMVLPTVKYLMTAR